MNLETSCKDYNSTSSNSEKIFELQNYKVQYLKTLALHLLLIKINAELYFKKLFPFRKNRVISLSKKHDFPVVTGTWCIVKNEQNKNGGLSKFIHQYQHQVFTEKEIATNSTPELMQFKLETESKCYGSAWAKNWKR